MKIKFVILCGTARPTLPPLTSRHCLKRYPEIKQKHAESVSKAPAAVTQDRIHGWFAEVSDYFKEKNLESVLLDPNHIFNGDESGFALCPKSGKVLGPARSKEDFYERVTSEKEQITVMATFSANGNIVPSMLIFPYKKMLGRSDSGWINSEVFYEYIANHFIPFLKSSNIIRPVVPTFCGWTSFSHDSTIKPAL
jgi:hypothetical protein